MGAQLTPHGPASASDERKDGPAASMRRPAEDPGQEQRADSAPARAIEEDEPALPRMPRKYPEPTD